MLYGDVVMLLEFIGSAAVGVVGSKPFSLLLCVALRDKSICNWLCTVGGLL